MKERAQDSEGSKKEHLWSLENRSWPLRQMNLNKPKEYLLQGTRVHLNTRREMNLNSEMPSPIGLGENLSLQIGRAGRRNHKCEGQWSDQLVRRVPKLLRNLFGGRVSQRRKQGTCELPEHFLCWNCNTALVFYGFPSDSTCTFLTFRVCKSSTTPAATHWK